MSIVGLVDFEQVRDFLYSRMRGARFDDVDDVDEVDEVDDVGEPERAPAVPAPGGDIAVALLTDIRDELRAVRERLQGGQS